MGQAVYAIDAFPDDDLLWRIEWIGGVGYNTSVPSEPQIDVCLAQLPKGEKNPLSARARSSQVEKRTVKIGVGLLPYVWIGSVWQKRRPVITNLSAYRGRVSIDATSLRMVALGMATSRDNAIPRSSYLFGASWPNVCRTLLVAVEQDGDPYAVMVPTAEIIRFYYGPSTRLAQALFWASTIILKTRMEGPKIASFCSGVSICGSMGSHPEGPSRSDGISLMLSRLRRFDSRHSRF